MINLINELVTFNKPMCFMYMFTLRSYFHRCSELLWFGQEQVLSFVPTWT